MIEISNLKNAYGTLNKAYSDYSENKDSILAEYIADSCVKRFEYTLKTAWKLVKKILIQKYGKTEPELTMNNIFRFMQGYGYAKNWEKKHLDRLKQEDKIIVEKRIKEMQDTKIDTIKEQEIPYEILEKTGTTYKFDKGDDEYRR